MLNKINYNECNFPLKKVISVKNYTELVFCHILNVNQSKRNDYLTVCVSFNEISVVKECKKMKGITYLSRFVTECEFYTWFYDIKTLFS